MGLHLHLNRVAGGRLPLRLGDQGPLQNPRDRVDGGLQRAELDLWLAVHAKADGTGRHI